MELINYEDLLDIRASRGVVADYSRPSINQIIQPPQSRQIMFDMFRLDPVIWTAIDLTADMVTYNGFSFDGKNPSRIEEANKRFNDELDFDSVMKNILVQLQIFGEAHLELIYEDAQVQTESGQTISMNSSRVVEINPLET